MSTEDIVEERDLPQGVAEALENIERMKAERQKPKQESDPQETRPPTMEQQQEQQEVEEREDFSAKYHTLQGKYNAETQRYREEIEQLRAQIGQILQAQQEQESEPPSQADPFKGLLDAGYDEDLVAVVRKQQEKIEQLEGRLKNELGQMQQEVRHSSDISFSQSLLNLVPSWKELNVDPGFLAWTEQSIPLTNMKRIDALRQAAQQGDVAKTAEFFKAYLEESGGGKNKGNGSGESASSSAAHDLMPETTSGEHSIPSDDGTLSVSRDIQPFRYRVATGHENDPRKIHEFEARIKAAQAAGKLVA